MRRPQANNPPLILDMLSSSCTLSYCHPASHYLLSSSSHFLHLHPLLHSTSPSFIPPLLYSFYFFCERASLIKAEPPFFSSLPWERRSFWEMKRLSREKCSRLSNSWTKAYLNDDKCHCLICSFGAFSGTLSTKTDLQQFISTVHIFTCKKL